MVKPYSEDLRKRVVFAVEGGLSRRQAAVKYDVAVSTVIGWMNRFRDEGTLAPRKIGGCKPKVLSGEHRE